jgi:hypothetical protein
LNLHLLKNIIAFYDFGKMVKKNTSKKDEFNSSRLSLVSGENLIPLKSVVIKIGIFTVYVAKMVNVPSRHQRGMRSRIAIAAIISKSFEDSVQLGNQNKTTST